MRSDPARGGARATLLLGAAALLSMLLVPIAAAAPDSRATASASIKKQVKKLKKKVNLLQQQIETVSKQPGPQGPPGSLTGPAGGDLTGTYPDPAIGVGAVNSAKVADGSIGLADLASNSVNSAKVVDNSLARRCRHQRGWPRKPARPQLGDRPQHHGE